MTELQIIAGILGLVAGFILSVTGAGGTLFSISLLVYFLHLTFVRAAPIALLAVFFSAGLRALLGMREGIVRYKAASLIALCGTITAPAGVWLAHRLTNDVLTMIFVIVLVTVAVYMLIQAHRQIHTPDKVSDGDSVMCKVGQSTGRLIWTAPCTKSMIFAGSSTGFLSGLIGVGGGFVIVPALRKFTNLEINSIVATSLAAVALISFVGVMGYAVNSASIQWYLALPFAAGSVIGMFIGRAIACHIAGPRVQQIFAVLALLIATNLLTRLL